VSSYRGTADGPDRAKAIAAVVAIHATLAFVILSGLDVQQAHQAAEIATTLDLREPAPPPPQPPPKPAPKPQAMKKPEGAPAKKAQPTPVVAPQPQLPAPSPLPAAKVAGTGSATTSGAAGAGTGPATVLGGLGPGGGGEFARFTPARRISKIPDSEYRALARTGLPSGSVGVTIRVNPDGSVSNCRVARSSGDSGIDRLMCELTLRYVHFDPARDPNGRPVAQDVTFFPNWWRP
jgi:periplasmic protein TonB